MGQSLRLKVEEAAGGGEGSAGAGRGYPEAEVGPGQAVGPRPFPQLGAGLWMRGKITTQDENGPVGGRPAGSRPERPASVTAASEVEIDGRRPGGGHSPAQRC